MAQLPPKVPNMTHQNWANFPHQRMPSLGNLLPSSNHQQQQQQQQQQHPSWVDEFLDFSSAKRGAHRRSASDSIAFLEAPFVEECRTASAGLRNGNHEFDRLDDEQLMSMFSDDISGATIPPNLSSSNPSTPSDHNSINDDQKPTPSDQQQQQQQQFRNNESTGEVESSCKSDSQGGGGGGGGPPSNGNGNGNGGGDPTTIDPKRVKRILANRQSAQRSRVRKLQYISELERSVTSLQTEVSTLSPRVAYLDHQRLVLNVDNSALKQRIAALAQDKIFKDAHQEALKKEIERLRQVYHQQNLKKMNTNNTNGTTNNTTSNTTNTNGTNNNNAAADTQGCTDEDQQEQKQQQQQQQQQQQLN